MQPAYLFWLCWLFISNICRANNIQIGPVTENINAGNHFLSFTISWENSWRLTNNPKNWDAVWIFIKRRDCAATQWQHVNLSDQDADHTAGSPLIVDASTDKKGVMIYRSVAGSGNISNVLIQLKLDTPPLGSYEYKVFGIEMVYVPQDPYYIGDGASANKFQIASTNNPYLVASEAPINISPNGSDLWSTTYPAPLTLPVTYPKGYQAFYCMKYEISQGQYTDFLNSLTRDAFQNRYDPSNANHNRYTISSSWPAMTTNTPDRACNWMSIDDLCAYLDWSALSPMTEMEFEKACRGASINIPVSNEFAWGSNLVTRAGTITPGTDGTASETVSDPVAVGSGLANYNGIGGPLRCGFAAKSATTRYEAGATYYGIMEMSGNVHELCVNADSAQYGRGFRFDGSNGDGQLSTSPNAGFSNENWPGNTPYDRVIEYKSYASRGGAWNSTLAGADLHVSDREIYTVLAPPLSAPDMNGRIDSFGGRGVSRRQ